MVPVSYRIPCVAGCTYPPRYCLFNRGFSCYCSNPGPTHYNLVVQVFRYLSATLGLGITFNANSENDVVSYTDSDYAGLVDSRKSTCGYIFMLSGGPLSHQSKLQSTVTLSSTEAEYMAITEAGKEALWISQFQTSLGFWLPNQPVDLRVDNKGTISLTENLEFHRKTKHIEVRWFLITEKVEQNEIVISYISTKEMLADGLTKALGPKIFKAFRKMIGMT